MEWLPACKDMSLLKMKKLEKMDVENIQVKGGPVSMEKQGVVYDAKF